VTVWLVVAAIGGILAVSAGIVFGWRRLREDPLTKGRRAIAGFRRDSAWLKKLPFTDGRRP
jgi:hypothetical protein